MQLILVPLFVISMLGDVIGRNKNNLKVVKICQPLTTFIVLLISLLSFLSPNHDLKFTIPIACGLAISTFADSILVSRNNKSLFIKGMALFLVAIITYGVTITALSGFHKKDIISSGVMLVIFLILLVLFKKGKDGADGIPSKNVTIGVTVYMFTFCFVISRAISSFNGDYFSKFQCYLLTIGTILFFLGDCQLGIYHFINKKFPMEQAPPFYFIGQLLIGLSCSYF